MTCERTILAGMTAIVSLLSTAAAEGIAPQAVSCKVIRTVAQLQGIGNDLAGSYCLGNDIDAGAVANFVPIGDFTNPFTGKFFGNNRVIRNLTISSNGQYVGLFGAINHAVIQDVGLVNADVTATQSSSSVGGLAGFVFADTGASKIRRVYVTGRVACLDNMSYGGGIIGSAQDDVTLADSWSAADVSCRGDPGGAIGYAFMTAIRRVHATGPVTCNGFGAAGGLVGSALAATISDSFASGPVTGENGNYAGGLVGYALNAAIERSHALGAVTTGDENSSGGGLVGLLHNGTVTEAYAVGRVNGGPNAAIGGLIGDVDGTPTVTNAYWDRITSKQMTSAAGLQFSTGEFRAQLPPGFGNAWAITRKRSYPFLDDADIEFTAPLATLVNTKKVYTFLPIDQHEPSEYAGASTGANAASLAAAYTMIARAIGITRNIAALKGVKIDTHFWDDTTKTTTWQGPVTTRATLGTVAAIAANVPLNDSNVIGAMKTGQLVLLRGTYTKGNGAAAKHWLLGTLYTTAGNGIGTVVANDPWTGLQAMIDPKTKDVVWPADFPLAAFRIDGYQPVTLN